jgi:hypothetical protein
MSQQRELAVEVVRIPAEGLSKEAAAAKMSIEHPDNTLRGIRPEPVEGYWVALFEKSALSKFDDDNTDSAPVGAGSSGFDHDQESLGDDTKTAFGGEEDGGGEEITLDKIWEKLLELEAVVNPAAGADDFGFDAEMTPGRFEGREFGGDDEGGLNDSLADTDRQQMQIRANTIKVTRERPEGMTVEQAKSELKKEASAHDKLRNYDIAEVDVTPDGAAFEATLVPKQRRRKR